MQLMLALEREPPLRLAPHSPTALVQAVADLLLEALGRCAEPQQPGQEASDEPQNHA